MPITPLQCRLARLATGWTANQLAAAAGISANTVLKFEKGAPAYARTLQAVRAAFEYAGVEFIAEDRPPLSGGEGIRFSPRGRSHMDVLTSERQKAVTRLADVKTAQPADKDTVQSIRQSAATRANLIKVLEEHLAAIDLRIHHLGNP